MLGHELDEFVDLNDPRSILIDFLHDLMDGFRSALIPQSSHEGSQLFLIDCLS